MRSLASVLVAAVLVVPACSKHESFCDTVRALVSSSTSVNVDVRAGDSAATVKAKVDAFARANAAAVRRQVTLLRRLERTAPADLKADVSLVVAAGVTFAEVAVGADLAAVSSMVDDTAKVQATAAAYARVRAATAQRCGVALDVAAADVATAVDVNVSIPPIPMPTFSIPSFTVPPIPSFPVPSFPAP